MLVDDVRSFRDGRRCHVARTATLAVELLRRLRGDTITQLWLDHDLGTDRHTGHALTIMPVVHELVQAAEAGQAYRIDTIMIHTANPRGAVLTRRVLEMLDLATLVVDLNIRDGGGPLTFQTSSRATNRYVPRRPEGAQE